MRERTLYRCDVKSKKLYASSKLNENNNECRSHHNYYLKAYKRVIDYEEKGSFAAARIIRESQKDSTLEKYKSLFEK